MLLVATVKRRENLPTWGRWNLKTDEGNFLMSVDIFSEEPDRFSSFFRRILSLCLDASLSDVIRSQLLSFLITAFQSLDNGLIRKECAPLVSISIWQHLHSESVREQKFERYSQLKKAWRAAAKRYEAADDATKLRLKFERAWLYSMILDFVARLNKSSQGKVSPRGHGQFF